MTDEPQLLQLRYRKHPWRLLVCCMLLNRTQRKQVDPVLPDLFGMYPNANRMAAAELGALEVIIHPLGFSYVRSQRLIQFSMAWVLQGEEFPTEITVAELPGVGRYALDSYRIFVLGRTDVEAQDKELKRWLDWSNDTSKKD